MILFCLPHAGSTSLSYYRWKPLLNPRIKFVPLDLPGHNIGKKSEFVSNFELAVTYLYSQIVTVLEEKRESYAIFGHSLGALLTYELYYCLIGKEKPEPFKLYISGRIPPFVSPSFIKGDLSKKIKVREDAYQYFVNDGLGLLNDKMDETLIRFYSDLLVADMNLMRSYKYTNRTVPVWTDTTILFGKDDISTPFEQLRKWDQLCKGKLSYVQIKGGHLFPLEHAAEIVNLINNDMQLYS